MRSRIRRWKQVNVYQYVAIWTAIAVIDGNPDGWFYQLICLVSIVTFGIGLIVQIAQEK